MPALLPTGGCPSSQLLHAFLYEIHLFQKCLLSVLSPCGLRFLFSLASCMDFLKSLTANSLPLTSAFSVCLCRAAQMLSYIHTHTQVAASLPHWAQLLTIAAFFSALTSFQPSFPLLSLTPTLWPAFFSRMRGVICKQHISISQGGMWPAAGDLCHLTVR